MTGNFSKSQVRNLCTCLAVLLLGWGLDSCSKKTDVKAEISSLEKVFEAAPAPAQSSGVPAAPVQSATTAGEVNTYVNLAVAAVRSNDYAAGVVTLEALQRMPGVTAQQLMALQKTKEAITADLIARADRGDPKAKTDLAAIEKTHSQ